ncbi:hypothetical protein PV350_13935 [Streptomyces sp. PA03-6a]|nr:hypothetical protein [Streptomyces sp. PA03-6a]
MTPQPMPPQDQDPDVQSARQAQATYIDSVRRARENWEASDLFKARQVADAYTTYLAALQDAWDRLQARRQARLDWLETQVPTGPGIPEGTSPADRSVLMAAFRAAYDRAMDSDRDGRVRLLSDAERFNDDAGRRGTLTAIVDLSEINSIRDWAQTHLTTAGYLDEVRDLREAIACRSTRSDHRLAQQAFTAVRAPQEVRELPQIERLAEAARARQAEQQRLSDRAYTAASRFAPIPPNAAL